MTCHWENSFKGLYDEKKIDYATLKMADNNLRIFFTQLMLKHDSKAFFYFKYEKKKYVSDQIRAVSNTKRKDNEVYLKIILAKYKAMKEVGEKKFLA